MAGPETYSGNGHTATIADPENITRDECLALARCGRHAWNSWREEFPTRAAPQVSNPDFDWQEEGWQPENNANFSNQEIENLSFSGFVFGPHADFSKTKFGPKVNFAASIFGAFTSFKESHFLQGATFLQTIFQGNVDFRETVFLKPAIFIKAKFFGNTIFYNADFRESFNALEAEFHGFATFACNSHLPFKDIELSGAKFLNSLVFDNREFQSRASFSGAAAIWIPEIKFQNNKPPSIANYPPINNEVLQRNCTTVFTVPPTFFNCKLNQNVSFEKAIFPSATGNHQSTLSYRALKLAFAQQHATHEEQRFFKLEMAEEAMAATGWKGWLYRAYDSISDFGFSVSRPLIKLVLMPALGAQFLYLLCMAAAHPELWTTPLAAQPQLASQWLQFTLMNLSPLPDSGALKELRHALFDQSSLASLMAMVVEIFQKLLAFTGYFLSGLALRNLFKMK